MNEPEFSNHEFLGSAIARQARGGNSDVKLIMKNVYEVFPDRTPLGGIHDCRII